MTKMKHFEMNFVDWTALALVTIGAINWGLVGLAHFVDPGANWNVMNAVLGSVPELEFAVYLLVGLAGLYEIYFASRVAGVETTESGMETESEMEMGEQTTPK